MLNSSGQVWLSGATTGVSIAVEVETYNNNSIGIDDTKVRRITGKTTRGTSISFSDFYSRYYRAYASVPNTVVYSSPGTSTYTVPTGVTSVAIKTIGGGGGGGAGNDGGYAHYGYAGSGGGSGYESSVTLAVSAGDVLYVSVGSGGTGGPGGCGPGGSPGSVGVSSIVTRSGSIFCSAAAGQGGVSGAQTNNPGGAGGNTGSNGSATQGTGSGGDGGASTVASGGTGGPGGGCGNGSGNAGSFGSGGGGGGSQNGSCCGHPGGNGGDGFVSITPNNAVAYNYSYTSQQGGLQNGGGSCLAGGDPSYATDQNGGWRAGDPLWPTAYQNNGLSCQYWGVTLDVNSTSSISYLRTLVTSGQMAPAFSNVSSIAADGSGTSFTATLNANYYLYSFNTVTSVCIMNTGRQITFYTSPTVTGIYYGTLGRSDTQTTLIAFNAGGCLWQNVTGAPGQVNVNVNAVGQGKFGNFRVQVDGVVVYTGGNGDSGCGGKNYGNVTVGPYTITSSSCILVEQYWWGCGNFQYGVNYITGGSWQIKADYAVA